MNTNKILSSDFGHEKTACPWCDKNELYIYYHNHVWGRPVRASQELFEKLCLDGQQAGLSWITILKKQENYREAYDYFDPYKLVNYDESRIEQLLQNPGIIRNRLKVRSIIKNAKAWLAMEASGESLSTFLWTFVGGTAIQNTWKSMDEVPASTLESNAMSRALKKYGFSFVGPTICYAFMQAVGMVNDHLVSCPQWEICHSLTVSGEI